MTRTSIPTAKATKKTAAPATTPVPTGIPVQFDLPPMTFTPFIEGKMTTGWEAPPVIGIRAVPITPVAVTTTATVTPVVTAKILAETGIARRESSGTPHWTFPAAGILVTLIGAWLVLDLVATLTAQTELAVKIETKKVMITDATVPEAQCTDIKTRDCSTHLNDGTYRQITPKGTQVRYGNCEQGTDDKNRPYMRCERISAYAEYVEGLPVQYRDFRHIGGNISLPIEGSRLID